MKEHFIKNNEVDICTESFGNIQSPCILLIMGATASMMYWDESFCERLSGKGYFVVRYDHRDTGKSTCYPEGQAPYSLDDMVDDAAQILNAYGIDNAHIMGMSLGGMLAQIMALKYPQKVLSIILFATMPWCPFHPDIPEMDSRIIDFQVQSGTINWDDEAAVVDYLSSGYDLIKGVKPYDKQQVRSLFQTEYRRANHYRSMYNHATLQGGEEYYGMIDRIEQPSLIIHGSEDKVCHYLHTEVLLRELKDSKLVTLQGTGHELLKEDWDKIIDSVDSFIKALKTNIFKALL